METTAPSTQTQIPKLLQLCAERLASMVNKKTLRYMRFLRYLDFPKIDITYIHYDYKNDEMIYVTCDFLKYLKKMYMDHIWNLAVVPSMPKFSDNHEFKIRIGKEQKLYVSTLADLGINMLKLDFPEGEYGLFPFQEGYILKVKDYSPKDREAIHVFANRCNVRGLVGTYHENPIENFDLLRLFNQYIREHVTHDDSWWRAIVGVPAKRVFDVIEGYSNIPVLFYLHEPIKVDDLQKITLTCASKINNCGNIETAWYVFHEEKGRIGIAIQQRWFFNMTLEFRQAGIGLLAPKGFRAIGNFITNYAYPLVHKKILKRYHNYKCEFKPCLCELNFKDRYEKLFHLSGGTVINAKGEILPPAPETRHRLTNKLIPKDMTIWTIIGKITSYNKLINK